MAVIINASTSTGLVQSADTSGIIQFQSNGSTKATLNSSGFSYPGGVLQVVQTVMTSAAAYNGSAFNEISPLNTSITPSSTSSRILIIPNIDYSAPNGYRTGLRIRRNGTDILLGDASSSRTRVSQLGRFFDSADQMVCQANRMYLDSPSSTSSVTYSFALSLENVTGNSIQINRTVSDADFASHFRGTSTVILMEIAG